MVVTNRYTSPLIDVMATKVWVNGPVSDHQPVELILYRNIEGETPVEVAATYTVTGEAPRFTYTWNNLDETDHDGNVYNYTVVEANVVDGVVVIGENDYLVTQDGNEITNTYIVPLIDVSATKVWNGGPSEDHVAVSLVLERSLDGVTWTPVEANYEVTGVAPRFTYTWSDLEETNLEGVKYTYRVVEPEVPENYTSSVEGMVVTNTYTSPLIDVVANKVWVNGPEEKPTVTFQLYRNGEPYGDSVELLDGQLEVTWNDLDITDFNGVNYVYTVREVGEVENYTKLEEGLTVTNTYVSPKIDIIVEKIWIDGPEVKPEITINLLRDGILFDSAILKDGETEYTFVGLDKTDKDGVDYVYTIEEETVEGYESVVNQFSVTNTFIIEKVSYQVEKIWVNGPEVKPTITIQLYRNGVAFGLPVELRHGTLKYLFHNLDKTDRQGNPYVYTVDELDVDGYTKKVEGFRITNTYIVEKIDIEIEKVWVNAPTVKPTIEVQLYRDGEKHLEPVKLADGVTRYTYKDLDKTDLTGKAYVYTIEEVTKLDNVTVSVKGFVITNTYKQELPKTGDTINQTPLIAMSLVAAGAYIIFMKKKEQE